MKSGLSGAVSVFLAGAVRVIETVRPRGSGVISLVFGLCSGLIAASTQAAFQVVDDFDSLTLGTINGQNGWRVVSTHGDVVVDPANGNNQALQVSTESGTLYKSETIAKDTTRMLFLRLRFEKHGRYSFGFSPLLNPDEYSDFGPELGMAAESAGDPSNEFRVANSLTIGIYDVLDALVPANWYNIWVLVNNDEKTYQVWMNTAPGGDARDSDQLQNSEASRLFGFRTSPDKDLISFYIKTGGGDSPVGGRFIIDDIYLENTGNANLKNPLEAPNHQSWLPPLLLYLLDD